MEERHLSLSEAIDVLGISERTGYRWIKSGKLRAYKPGRDYWIPESAIKEVVEKSKVRPKADRRSSYEPSFNDVLAAERRQDDEAALAILFRGLARRARLIVERSRREGPSVELGEDAAALHADATALYRLRGSRDIRGTGSEELATAVDTYEEVEGTIQAMLRQDVEASDEARDTARRFRPDAKSKHRKVDAS